MMPAIEMERYDKNVSSVRKICKELGFILNGSCPDWYMYTDKTKHNTIIVPDDFMAHIALLFGYDWDFGYQNRDEDLENSIKFLKGNIEIVSQDTAIEKIAKKFNIVDKELQINIDSLKETHKKQIEEYEEKIKNLKFILETRNNLREKKKNSGKII